MTGKPLPPLQVIVNHLLDRGRDLSPETKVVAFVGIGSHLNRESRFAFVADRTLAKNTKLAPRTVARSIAKLGDLFEIVRGTSATGAKRTATTYKLKEGAREDHGLPKTGVREDYGPSATAVREDRLPASATTDDRRTGCITTKEQITKEQITKETDLSPRKRGLSVDPRLRLGLMNGFTVEQVERWAEAERALEPMWSKEVEGFSFDELLTFIRERFPERLVDAAFQTALSGCPRALAEMEHETA